MKKYHYPFYLLKVQRFLPFFLTQFFGALNDNVFKLSVLTLIAFYLSDAIQGPLYQALGAGLFTLPFFLFSASAGQLADKYDKAFLMRCIKCIEIAFMMLGSIGIYYKNIPGMMAVIFLMGLHSTFFGPLKYAILPEQLEHKELLAGNAFVEAGTFIAILIGTILGSVFIPQSNLFLQSGLKWVCVTIISIAFLGALASFFIPSNQFLKQKNANLKIDWFFLSATRTVWCESKKHPYIYSSIIGISWFWFIGATLITEFPVYVKYTLGAEKNVFTFFFSIVFSGNCYWFFID